MAVWYSFTIETACFVCLCYAYISVASYKEQYVSVLFNSRSVVIKI